MMTTSQIKLSGKHVRKRSNSDISAIELQLWFFHPPFASLMFGPPLLGQVVGVTHSPCTPVSDFCFRSYLLVFFYVHQQDERMQLPSIRLRMVAQGLGLLESCLHRCGILSHRRSWRDRERRKSTHGWRLKRRHASLKRQGSKLRKRSRTAED